MAGVVTSGPQICCFLLLVLLQLVRVSCFVTRGAEVQKVQLARPKYALYAAPEAVSAFEAWYEGEAPSIVESTADTVAGVVADFYGSVSTAAGETVVVAPRVGAGWGAAQVYAVEGALRPAAAFRAVYHPESHDEGLRSPHFALHHHAGLAAAAEPPASQPLPTREDVMEDIFTWFQNQLLREDLEEEEFIDLGRKMITIQEVVVSWRTSRPGLLSRLLGEAMALPARAAIQANEEENSVLIVAPFLGKGGGAFAGFVQKAFGGPLAQVTAQGMGASDGVLVCHAFPAEDGLRHPMVLVHPVLVELEAPEDAKVMTFTELLQSCTDDAEEGGTAEESTSK
ncbi:unnamed protein product [Heterosigma akashiwo]